MGFDRCATQAPDSSRTCFVHHNLTVCTEVFYSVGTGAVTDTGDALQSFVDGIRGQGVRLPVVSSPPLARWPSPATPGPNGDQVPVSVPLPSASAAPSTSASPAAPSTSATASLSVAPVVVVSGGSKPSRWPPATDYVSGTVLVLAKYDEDTSWVSQQPYPYVIMTKDKSLGDVRDNVMMNKGQEADCYIKFILDNYDDLPPRMIFMQAHQVSWHNPDKGVRATLWLCSITTCSITTDATVHLVSFCYCFHCQLSLAGFGVPR